MKAIFVTGIGTGVGKTIVSAIITEALQADYWKPVQAGFDDGTDALSVTSLISNDRTKIFPEVYKLAKPASPHIAARAAHITIELSTISSAYQNIVQQSSNDILIIEGAGGLMVPLNTDTFVADLIKQLDARVILVSRNYLGSINHSLLTAAVCQQKDLNVIGWIFNDQYMDYEEEIVAWSGYNKLGSVPFSEATDKNFIAGEAKKIKASLLAAL